MRKIVVLALILLMGCTTQPKTISQPSIVPTQSGTPLVPAHAAQGEAPNRPIPFGQTAWGRRMTLTVMQVIRPADDVVIAASEANLLPPGQEWVLITLRATCGRDICVLNSWDFSLVGPIDHEYEWTAGLDVFQGNEFSEGSTIWGSVAFLVGRGEKNLVLMYDTPSDLFTRKLYMALN